MIVPLFLVNVHASGCITSCRLTADTTVPAADGTVYVELDNNTGSVFSLPHTFSFANNTRHTLTVMNTTFSAPSGARYVWNEWVHSSLQWTPTLMMQTPIMLFNYTGPSDGGPFTAKFDKQFQYTLTFKDAAGNHWFQVPRLSYCRAQVRVLQPRPILVSGWPRPPGQLRRRLGKATKERCLPQWRLTSPRVQPLPLSGWAHIRRLSRLSIG